MRLEAIKKFVESGGMDKVDIIVNQKVTATTLCVVRGAGGSVVPDMEARLTFSIYYSLLMVSR